MQSGSGSAAQSARQFERVDRTWAKLKFTGPKFERRKFTACLTHLILQEWNHWSSTEQPCRSSFVFVVLLMITRSSLVH